MTGILILAGTRAKPAVYVPYSANRGRRDLYEVGCSRLEVREDSPFGKVHRPLINGLENGASQL